MLPNARWLNACGGGLPTQAGLMLASVRRMTFSNVPCTSVGARYCNPRYTFPPQVRAEQCLVLCIRAPLTAQLIVHC